MTDLCVRSDYRIWVLAEEGWMLGHFGRSIQPSFALALRKMREVVPAHAEHVAPRSWDGGAQLRAVERSAAFRLRRRRAHAVPHRGARGDETEDVLGRPTHQVAHRDHGPIPGDHARARPPACLERANAHQPTPSTGGAGRSAAHTA